MNMFKFKITLAISDDTDIMQVCRMYHEENSAQCYISSEYVISSQHEIKLYHISSDSSDAILWLKLKYG